MDVSLLRALRVVAAADTDPVRQILFGNLLQARRVVRTAYALHARLTGTWLSAVVVASYGVAYLLRIAAPTGRPAILAVAKHANARRQVDRVGDWIGRDRYQRLPLGFGFRAVAAGASALAGSALNGTLWRSLRIIRILDRRHGFLVACRSAAAIAWYARTTTLLALNRPGAVLVSSDSNPEEVGFTAAAAALSVPRIFVSHAYPTPFSPRLDCELAILEGEAAVSSRRRKGPLTGDVVFAGVEGESAPLDLSRLGRANPVIGIFTPKAITWATLAAVIAECREVFGARRIVIRWHPSRLDQVKHLRSLGDISDIEESPASATLGDVARLCDWVIADENSNVHLPVLKLGIPTVVVKGLGLYPESRADMYGFAAAGVVFPAVRSLRDLDVGALTSFFAETWTDRFRQFDASYLRPQADVQAEVRMAVDRVLEESAPVRAGRLEAAPADAVAPMKTGWTTRIAAMVSLAVSGGLLVTLYRSLDFRLVAHALLQADPWWLVISVGMIVPITLLRAVRFYWVAPPGALPGLGEALRLTLVASALNVFLPAKAGDLVKSYFVATRSKTEAGVALSMAVYERLCDFFGLISCCLLLWVIGKPQVNGIPAAFWPLLGGFDVACLLLIGSRRVARAVRALAETALPRGRLRKVRQLADGWPALLRSLGGRRRWIMSYSLVLWFTHLVQLWLFTRALSVPVPFAVAASLSAVALMAGQVPFTVAGLGARDVVLVVLLARYTTAESAAAMGVLISTRGLLPPLMGLPIMRHYLSTAVEDARRWRQKTAIAS